MYMHVFWHTRILDSSTFWAPCVSVLADQSPPHRVSLIYSLLHHKYWLMTLFLMQSFVLPSITCVVLFSECIMEKLVQPHGKVCQQCKNIIIILYFCCFLGSVHQDISWICWELALPFHWKTWTIKYLRTHSWHGMLWFYLMLH